MPFGLYNAPATFQREMNRIFFNLIGKCVFIYIDDLVVFSNSWEQHVIDLEEVFTILKDNGLKLNIEKCHFFQEEVHQKFALIAKPLFKLLKKNAEFEWNNEADVAFKVLKEKLIKAPILTLPNFEKPFIICTDASRSGIGGVLMQKDEDGIEKPIHFVSRALKKAEENYSVTDLEGTVAVYCVKKFKHYILRNKLKTSLITDHKPLVGICNKTEPTNNRHLKWVTTLSVLQVKVQYEEGRKNVIADVLSRMESKNEEADGVILLSQTIESFLKDKILTIDGIEYYKQNGRLRKIIHQNETKFKLIESAHAVGHEGAYKTYHWLKPSYYWKCMNKDIHLFIKCCPKCQMYKPQKQNNNAENIPTKPGLPFTRVGLDLIGPLPKTRRGNRYIIVLVVYFTKWVEAKPLKQTSSDEVIRFLKMYLQDMVYLNY